MMMMLREARGIYVGKSSGFVLCDFVDYDVERVWNKELVKSPGMFLFLFVSLYGDVFFCTFCW